MATYEANLGTDEKLEVTGVKGMKSKPFRKTFKNQKALDKWLESEDAQNYEVQYITRP